MKLLSMFVAALFAVASLNVVAQPKDKKPTPAECKKDPKMKGCEPMKDKKDKK